MLVKLWTGSSLASRATFVGFGAMVIAATVALGAWSFRSHDELLFGNLPAHELASMARQLEQSKIAYRFGEDGRSIHVESGAVHATRLKLMGNESALQGAVGLELFNDSDFGATEFAQRVNYQRALQGELARTIVSLAEVESARVHLALPEEGIFRRGQNRPKASIVLSLRNGAALHRQQVAGIQRLVAAAVPGIAFDDVVLADHRGIALSKADASGDDVRGSVRLEVKREIEEHLTRKATQVLDGAFGAGNAMATVDVTLDMNQVRTTVEDVLTPPVRKGEAPAGVVQRERETLREEAGSPGHSQREVDYQLGRRTEQVIATPGSIVRVHVAAVVRPELLTGQQDQVKALLAAAVGAVRERGDTVVVHALARKAIDAAPTSDSPAVTTAAKSMPPSLIADRNPNDEPARVFLEWATWKTAGLVAVLAACAAPLALAMRRGTARRHEPESGPVERQMLLGQVRRWLEEEPSSTIGTPERRS